MGAFDHLIPKTQAAPANRFSHLVPSAPATPRVNLMDVINQEPTELPPEFAATLALTSPATAIQAGIPLPMPAPDPEGFVANAKDFGAGVMEAFTGVGDVVRSAAADVVGLNEQLDGALNVHNILNPLRLYDLATKAARGELPGPKPEYAGNIRAMIEQPGAQLPVDEFLGEVAQTNPALATAGKFAQTTAQTAPLLAIGGLPQWLQRLAALGFSTQMVSHAPELARELGTEMGKPPGERDLDKLTTLTSDAIATGLFAPLAGYGGVKDIALTKGDARRVAIRDLAKQLKQEPLLEIPFELPLRPRATPMRARPGVESMDIVQSPFEAPWVREHARTLIDRAILEAQGRAVTQPGELPALELLRRAIGPSEIVTGEPTIRVDRPGGGRAQGGRISFAGEAEARGVPSARQSALPRTVEQIQRERAQDAIIERQVQESREPQRPQAPERRLPAETERRNRTGEGGDEPPSPAAEVVPKPPPKPPASPQPSQNLPDWARDEMERRGLDPARTFNDIDLQNPSVRQAIEADPTLTEAQKQSLLTTGALPPSPAPEVAPKPPPKPPASPRAAEIERISQQSADDFLAEFRKPGGLTKAAYDFAETLTKEDLASLEAAREAAIAEQTRILKEAEGLTDRAAKLDAMQRGTGFGFKQQFFNEAAKWRRALDEAKETGAKTPEEFRAIEQKYGVGISEKTELMDAAKRLGIVPEAKPGPTGKIPKPQRGMVRLYQGSGGAEGAGTAGSFWTQDVNRARSYGPNIRYVDVPEQAFKAGQEAVAKRGQAPGSDAIIPDELARQAKEFTGEVPERVIDLDTPVGEPAQPPAAPAAAAPPNAGSLFREASAAEVDAYVNPSTEARVPFGTPQIFAATSRELAIGQGRNKSGIVVEFDPKGLDVTAAREKPGSPVARQTGAGEERIIRAQWPDLRGNVRSITISNNATPDPYLLRLTRFLKDNWTAETSESGTIYRPRKATPKATELAPEAKPVPTPTPNVSEPPALLQARRRLEELRAEGKGKSDQAFRLRARIAKLEKEFKREQSGAPRRAFGVTGRERFRRETEAIGTDILDWIVDQGGLLSKSEAVRTMGKEWWETNKADWEDAPSELSAPHHNIIYGGKQRPNQLAQAAFDAGKIPDAKPSTLWRAIKDASTNRKAEIARQKREAALLQQEAEQFEAWQKETGSPQEGDVLKNADDLSVGDVMEVAGERVEVASIDPDTMTVTLEDGRKFGTQKLESGQSIWVEKFKESGGDVIGEFEKLAKESAAERAAAEKAANEADRRRKFDEKIRKISAEQKARADEAETASRDAEIVRLDDGTGKRIIITKSVKQPGKWQATLFTREGDPWMDFTYDSLADAVRHLVWGDAPSKYGPPPFGGPEFKVVAARKATSKSPEPAPARPQPQVKERPLTKAEQAEFEELSLKAKRAREEGGPQLTTEETQRYNYLTALAGQKELLVESASQNFAARLKALEDKAAELDRQRVLAQNRAFESKFRRKEFMDEAKVYDRELQEVRAEIRKLKSDRAIEKLESLKRKNNPGELFSLPDPKIFQSYGKAFWNTGIDVAIASIRAGRSIAQAIDTAIARMRDFARERGMSVDWKGVRKNLTAILREETGTPKPPSATVATGTGEGGTRMRLSAEHATTSPMVPKQVQKRIATAPESFYEPQSMARVESDVAAMTSEQLAAVSPESDIYTAAKLEQADRLFKAGQDEAGYQVFVELEKQGTRWGQLINQFKLLRGSTPEGMVRVINEKLKRSKRDPLTKEQAERVKTTVKKSKEKDAALDEATEVWRRDPTAENARAAETALDAANQAALELQKLASRFQPRSLWSTAKSLLQGNLLTPISEVANLVGNTSFMPFRMGSRAVGATIDLIDSAIRQRPRQLTVQPLSGTRQAALGMMRSLREMGQIAVRGTGDTIKGETRAGLHPVRAWMTQFARNPDVPTVGGKVPLTDRIGLLLEGTLGIPAETMLRGLAIGDVPFRRAAESRIIAEQLRLKGVPRDQWSFAQKFPELFFDRATMEQMRQESLGAIFQGKSTTLQALNQLIRNNWLTQRGVKPELIDFFVATVAPYKLTPWKITGEILSFNPIVALARTAWEAKRGNIRAAEINAGKFVMGSMLTGAAVWLYDKGLLAPSLDSRNEAQKARILSGEVLPPNHINLSGLRRAMAGGSPEFQAGDKTVDVFRAGGLAGSMMYLVANIGRELEKRPDTTQADLAGSIIRQSTLEQAQFAMNQSYLSGIEGLLTAIRDGNTDSYVRQYMRTVLAIPFPNTLDTFSRATREHKVDVSEDKFSKQIENLVRSKLGFAGLDDYMPLRRGLWGEPLPETPKSRNAFFYHFFDIFKGKQVTDDPVSLMLYKLWRDTNDSRAIPPLPERTMTHLGVTYQLTPEQHSRYAELVGGRRRYYIDQVMQNPEFKKASTEMKLRVLSIVWDAGRERGKSEFIKEEEGNLQRKLK